MEHYSGKAPQDIEESVIVYACSYEHESGQSSGSDRFFKQSFFAWDLETDICAAQKTRHSKGHATLPLSQSSKMVCLHSSAGITFAQDLAQHYPHHRLEPVRVDSCHLLPVQARESR